MGSLSATIKTNKGEIKLDLFADQTPVTVANFVNLVQHKFYDRLTFHRVLDEFMIQGGCPSGDGTGGPGYQFENECTDDLKHDKPGILSMANSGADTNGSQFFVTHVPTPWLDGLHTVFGAVASDKDMEVVNSIEQDDGIETITIKGDVKALLKKVSDRVSDWDSALEKV